MPVHLSEQGDGVSVLFDVCAVRLRTSLIYVVNPLATSYQLDARLRQSYTHVACIDSRLSRC